MGFASAPYKKNVDIWCIYLLMKQYPTGIAGEPILTNPFAKVILPNQLRLVFTKELS